VPFFNYPHLVILKRKLKQGDHAPIHKLSGDGATSQTRKFLLDEAYVLSGLNNADLVFAPLGLDRNHVMTPPLVEADVQFVNLYLSNAPHGRTKVILQTVGS